MSEIEKRVIKGFYVDKATEDQLNDLSTYELIDIVLFFREQLHCYKQAIKEIKDIANKDFRHTSWEEYAKQLKQIIQKCEEVND